MTVPARILYGLPPLDLHQPAQDEVQTSPLVPGSQALETVEPASVEEAAVLAPPGVVERRYVLALVLRALKPGAALTALAPKDKGGSRLKKELEAFGCEVVEAARRHHRICHVDRPADLVGVDNAIAEGASRIVQGLWSQPGVFSWDRVDPGTAALLKALPPLSGQGADLGCGIGVLAHTVLASPAVTRLHLIDVDRRAADCARRNVDDPRADFAWADAASASLEGLDFVVMNPPFHDAGWETKALGQRFIEAAHRALRKGGVLWMVANLHLPYEAVLEPLFSRVERRDGDGGGPYKVFEAKK
ncbi:MAG TPA: class I SAM-dependent methyltransferase [Caulobacteraceae bacterium]|jgi:16S rRNA (guanine1207-N2)-methyltransferase